LPRGAPSLRGTAPRGRYQRGQQARRRRGRTLSRHLRRDLPVARRAAEMRRDGGRQGGARARRVDLDRRRAHRPGRHRRLRRLSRGGAGARPVVVLVKTRTVRTVLAFFAGVAWACGGAGPPRAASPLLEEMTWPEAERALGPDTIVVVPIGAASKEHGPHLRLANDWIMADFLRRRVAERTHVVVAPIVGFSYYPAFVEYPGSIHLRLETARALLVDIVRSLARYGPRRFYALNTGVSTLRALAPAAEALAADGILFRYTDLGRALGQIEKEVAKQPGGTHA